MFRSFVGLAIQFVRLQRELIVEECHRLREGFDRVNVDSFDDRRLLGIFFRHDDAAKILLFCEHRHGQCAFDLANASIQRELTRDQKDFVGIGGD